MRYLWFFFLISFSVSAQENQAPHEDALSGTLAKNFEVTVLSGEKVSLVNYQGKVLLINIWDTICPPCIAEFPGFIDLYSKYKSKGFEVLGLTKALYEDSSGVEKFLKKHKLNYPNAIVTKAVIDSIGGTKGIPTTYLIDKNGKIYKRYFGYRKKEVFENDIQELLR